MSAVRLEPLMMQAKEFFSSRPSAVALRNAVSRSDTSCDCCAITMWHGATTDAPRPPPDVLTKTDPVCAISASARVMVACELSAGTAWLDQRTGRLMGKDSIVRRNPG